MGYCRLSIGKGAINAKKKKKKKKFGLVPSKDIGLPGRSKEGGIRNPNECKDF